MMSTHYLLLMSYRTIQDVKHGLCICLRVDFLRQPHFGKCTSCLACSTEGCGFILQSFTSIRSFAAYFNLRTCATGVLALLGSRDLAGLNVRREHKGMAEAKKDAPRRYIADGVGQRVLVGLTSSETIEFERLDNAQASPGSALREEKHCLGQNESDERWLELYTKHERAWRVWMTESRLRLPPLRVFAQVSSVEG